MSTIKRTMGPSEWTMLLILSLVWGGSFFFFAVAVKHLPTFTIVFARVSLATLLLWATVVALGHGVPRSWAMWRQFLAMGLLNNAIPFSLIVYGQREIASGLAAILNATTPFFALIVANALTSDEKLSANKLAGVAIGLLGVATMLGLDLLEHLGQALTAQLAVLCASVFYGFATVYGRRFAANPPIVTAAGQTAGSTLILLPLMLVIDRPWTLEPPPLQVWLALAGLATVCTAFAYVLFFAVLKRAGATNLALVTFLVPVSAIALGVLFLGEHLAPRHVLGMAGIGLGLALIDGRLVSLLLRRPAV
ncbi:MAG: DMT family transporter [Parvibaculaceae bacterium]